MYTNRNQGYYRMPNQGSSMRNNMQNHSGCGCTDRTSTSDDRHIDQFPIGMAYVPWQCFRDMYDPHVGLSRGTIFKELDYPFYGKRGNCP